MKKYDEKTDKLGFTMKIEDFERFREELEFGKQTEVLDFTLIPERTFEGIRDTFRYKIYSVLRLEEFLKDKLELINKYREKCGLDPEDYDKLKRQAGLQRKHELNMIEEAEVEGFHG